MGKFFSILFLGFLFSLSSFAGDPVQPTAQSFCRAEIEARQMLASSYPIALGRARAYLAAAEKAGRIPDENPQMLPAVAMGQSKRNLPADGSETAGPRLKALVQEFERGPGKLRTAMVINDDLQIEAYLAKWHEVATTSATVDPDDVRPPLRFSFRSLRNTLLLSSIPFTASLSGLENRFWNPENFYKLPDLLVHNAGYLAAAGGIVAASGLLFDAARYAFAWFARADDIPAEIQGAARVELALQHLRANYATPTSMYFGTRDGSNGEYVDVIYETIRGRPILTVFRWTPETPAVVADSAASETP